MRLHNINNNGNCYNYTINLYLYIWVCTRKEDVKNYNDSLKTNQIQINWQRQTTVL